MKKAMLVISAAAILFTSCAKNTTYGTARSMHQTHKCNGSKGIRTPMGRM